jgi:hypothetical protein
MRMSGERRCPNCGAPLQEAQDWCLQCGAAAAESGRTAPGWRSAALAIGATSALALGAAAAAYAALEQHPARRRPTPVTQTPPVTSQTAPPTSSPGVTPGTTTPGARLPSLPSSPPALNTPSGVPQIPSSTPTPHGHEEGEGGGEGNGREEGREGNGRSGRHHNGHGHSNGGGQRHQGGESTESPGGEPEGEAGEGEKRRNQPLPILLDTNAAEVYDPQHLPTSRFGDPSLAIDGEATTAWSVQLEPAQAPAVEVGLELDLNAALRVVKLSLVTETPGMTVQVYGTSDRTLPASLSSTAWVRLSHAHLVKKRRATIELKEATKRFRRLLIWVMKAPTSSGGQPTGSEVKLNEVQLYEPR